MPDGGQMKRRRVRLKLGTDSAANQAATDNDCPKCGLVSPPGAERCDCGYDFHSRSMQHSYNEQAVRDNSTRRRRNLTIGLCFSLGLVVLGMFRLAVGEPFDGMIMVGGGVVAAVGCGIVLMRSS